MNRLRGEDGDHELGSRSKKTRRGSGGSGSASNRELHAAGLEYFRLVGRKLGHRPDLVDKFKQVLRDFGAGKIHVSAVVQQAEEIFQGHGDLIFGFNAFLPEEYKISLEDDKTETEEEEEEKEEEDDDNNGDENLKFGGKFEEALLLVNKVKLQFQDGGGDYKAFLDVWVRDDGKMIGYDEFDDHQYNKVTQFLGGHPHLLEDFNSLLGFHAAPDLRVDDHDPLRLHGRVAQVVCNVEKVVCHECYLDLLKKMHDYNERRISRDDLEAAVTYILGSNRNLVEEFFDIIKYPEEQSSNSRKFGEEKEEQKRIKSVDELDFSKCRRISHSYWLLPDGERLEGEDGILNDKLVCVSPGDGNFPFSDKKIEQHEEVVHKCEDDRYEMDMLIGSIRSAIDSVKKLQEAIVDDDDMETGIDIEDHLSVLNRRCIERLYGDHGLQVMEVLHEKPIQALPVIMKRLHQKHQEVELYRLGFDKICANRVIQADKSLLQKKPLIMGNQQKLSRERCFDREMQK